jgi:dTDP-D-glucose 4,6-dehydratase
MGYAPRIPSGDGLKSTVRWYEENRAWWEPLEKAQAGHPPQPGPGQPERAQPELAE